MIYLYYITYIMLSTNIFMYILLLDKFMTYETLLLANNIFVK